MAPSSDRDKALDTALANIDRQFGKGSVMRLGDDVRAPIEVIPTGSIALDIALGIGGLPRGRVVEIYGPESSGKPPWRCTRSPTRRRPAASRRSSTPSTRLDPDYAQKLGVDTDGCWCRSPTPVSRRSRSRTC
jgi:recombination protein RecA